MPSIEDKASQKSQHRSITLAWVVGRDCSCTDMRSSSIFAEKVLKCACGEICELIVDSANEPDVELRDMSMV